ncbi:hypothetical protein GRI89_04985 [Altererythrobacter salegens]|uniref:Terminase n=1 Tax=Croceibacterium salegens TaxID=1737568 RepID=A0A6I4SSI4_9SPHN|nr:P27 family phage terminase small subunit [Croceibacterium salegens]MXO58894.1 hypothetical protein [Croceibacterium salegens]
MTADPSDASPPAHLSPASAEFWRQVLRDYQLESHHLKLLECACGALDRMTEAREELAKHGGLVFTDGSGVIRLHPCEAVERNARVAFIRALRELGLDAGLLPETPRPPALPGIRQ